MKKLTYILMMIAALLVIGCVQRNDTMTLSSMLDKNINGDEIQRWLSKVGDSPAINKFAGICFFYDFKQKGISLRFDTNGTLTDIFLYSEGADGFRQYKGELPFKLSFILSRKEVESILGKPDTSDDSGVTNYKASYISQHISITYNSKQKDDLNTLINCIGIHNRK